MYYYIFDIKKCRKRSQVESIKNYLSFLGISGEFTYPTSAQNIKELINLGLSKQYTTIVGIGDDQIANEIATCLIGRQEAMGFIPLEISNELHSLIGTSDWKEACDILRFRKINEMNLGRVASGECFLTNIKLDLRMPIEVTLEFKDYIVQAKTKELIIANFDPAIKKIGNDFLDVRLKSMNPANSALVSKVASFLGMNKDDNESAISLFRARSLRIFTKMKLPLVSYNKTIAKTPQLIESTDEVLRLITAKKSSDFWQR